MKIYNFLNYVNMFKNLSEDLINDMIYYYKYELAKEKEQNQALDPLNIMVDADIKVNEITKRLNLLNQNTFLLGDIQNNSLIGGNISDQQLLQDLGQKFDIVTKYDDWLNNKISEDTKKQAEQSTLFKEYFLPLLVAEASYKKPEDRKDLGGDMIKYVEGNDEVALYKYKDDYYIGLKGTNSLKDLNTDLSLAVGSSIYEKIKSLFSNNNIQNITEKITENKLTQNEETILGDVVKQTIEEYLKKYPANFILSGHSLGGSRSSILNKKYSDRIKKAYGFNVGQSPIPFGWKHESHPNFIHYKIKGDSISDGALLLPQKDDKLISFSSQGGVRRGDEELLSFYNHILERFYDPLFTDVLRKKFK
ncbi:MAG: hypothetical protein H6630_08945 [Arcobacter sp.]|nr:hypothetical protein [Arcobacter sp.]